MDEAVSKLLADAHARIAMPDTVWSPFGDLRLVDGVPEMESVDRAYEVADLIRGVDVYLNCLPGASLVAMRAGFRSIGVDSPRVLGLWDPRANSRSLWLTANTETTYAATFLDLRADGPTVVEAPPNSLCVVNDFWFRYVADLGIGGPDGGAGGKYLFLPPGHDGEVPDGYYVYRSATFTNWLLVRALGGPPDIEKTKVYPLTEAPAPPAMTYVNFAEITHNTIHSNDYSFYEEIDTLVQEEQTTALDPERAGQLAAIGIVHGQPFAPDERRRRVLAKAAPLGAALARAFVYKPRDPEAYRYEASTWCEGFIGGSYEFLRDGARLLDARTMFHYAATVVTPAMAHPQVGAGSAYLVNSRDAAGTWLDGGRHYALRLPPDAPAKNFWSVDVYDTQTRSLLQTGNPCPAVMSLGGAAAPNEDGSVTVRFGPDAPDGHDANWIQTVPGKRWFTVLRLYGPLQPYFDKTWKPGEIEPV